MYLHQHPSMIQKSSISRPSNIVLPLSNLSACSMMVFRLLNNHKLVWNPNHDWNTMKETNMISKIIYSAFKIYILLHKSFNSISNALLSWVVSISNVDDCVPTFWEGNFLKRKYPMIVAIEQLNPKAELLANPVINLGGFDHRKVPYIPAALPTWWDIPKTYQSSRWMGFLIGWMVKLGVITRTCVNHRLRNGSLGIGISDLTREPSEYDG